MQAHDLQMEAPQEQLENLVIVTGFGPVNRHETVNASWQTVRLLPDTIFHENTPYKLEKIEIPFEYEAVDKAIEDIWSRRPILVIHCGVDASATCINLEKLAYNNHFRRPDKAGKYLPDGKVCLKNYSVKKSAIFCKLNIKRVLEVVRENFVFPPVIIEGGEHKVIVAKQSQEVGNYLGGYIYLKSLDRDCKRSLFVHLPSLDRPFSAEKLSEVLLKITEEFLKEVAEEEFLKRFLLD